MNMPEMELVVYFDISCHNKTALRNITFLPYNRFLFGHFCRINMYIAVRWIQSKTHGLCNVPPAKQIGYKFNKNRIYKAG